VSKVKGKGKGHSSRRKSFYKLSEIRQKIAAGNVLINSNAKRCAFQDFGWGMEDILNAYRNLRPKHFYKTASYKGRPTVAVDYYKANLYGEDIYTHFYIDDTEKKLVINSFKKI